MGKNRSKLTHLLFSKTSSPLASLSASSLSSPAEGSHAHTGEAVEVGRDGRGAGGRGLEGH